MKSAFLPSLLAALLSGISFTPAFSGTSPPPTIPEKPLQRPLQLQNLARSLVRVNCTLQAYDFHRPWAKKSPTSRRGLGVVVDKNKVLVTADLVANHTYIEFERPASGERVPAFLQFVDYEANLALLSAASEEFLATAPPLSLDETARVGSAVEILQLEPNGEIAETNARITTITVGNYLVDDTGFLLFRLSAPIQQRDGSYVLPAVHNSRLLGLLMRYDSRNQTADLIPPPVIRRFLEEATSQSYQAFPRAGIGFSPLRDPQLRKYLGLEKNGGVFISKVEPGSAVEGAGVEPGDVLLSIDGVAIDSDGTFSHSEYGRIPMSFLITMTKLAGDTVELELFRDGEKRKVPVRLERRDRNAMSVPPYLFDQQPGYLVAGGLVFQELTREYLREWGADWRGSAPRRLVYADVFQHEERPEGEKVVFLSSVIPTPATLGYENLSGLVVTSVDGQPIHSLKDMQEALATPQAEDGIFRIGVADDPRILYLDAKMATEAEAILSQQYGLQELSHLP